MIDTGTDTDTGADTGADILTDTGTDTVTESRGAGSSPVKSSVSAFLVGGTGRSNSDGSRRVKASFRRRLPPLGLAESGSRTCWCCLRGIDPGRRYRQ